MLSAILLALSPFALNMVMGVVKWLSPLETTASKRVVLALFSLAGVIATSAMTGAPVDPNLVSNILTVLVEAFVAFVLAHGSYTLFWKAER
ncbi:hypothetical protein GGQ85_003636 [Nitrobacter vulgaris]|uniref:hypothetical protein n=1 Tax=Nitrobacter vulgaris TaxID=29421 RepID=UPI0028670ECC|nr:hypothetical protein [Nitrobacter vulgaris]MDR6305910.1 hypothetical protein [Nitrobacter vulgaris]